MHSHFYKVYCTPYKWKSVPHFHECRECEFWVQNCGRKIFHKCCSRVLKNTHFEIYTCSLFSVCEMTNTYTSWFPTNRTVCDIFCDAFWARFHFYKSSDKLDSWKLSQRFHGCLWYDFVDYPFWRTLYSSMNSTDLKKSLFD